MTSEAHMVERVARAICQQDEQNGGAPWDWYDAKGHDRYLELARAALVAMREPTEAMLGRGWEAFSPPLPQIGGQHAMWAAMIDAALAEGEK